MAHKRHLHQAQGVYFGFCFYCGYRDRYSVSNLWIIFFRIANQYFSQPLEEAVERDIVAAIVYAH